MSELFDTLDSMRRPRGVRELVESGPVETDHYRGDKSEHCWSIVDTKQNLRKIGELPRSTSRDAVNSVLYMLEGERGNLGNAAKASHSRTDGKEVTKRTPRQPGRQAGRFKAKEKK